LITSLDLQRDIVGYLIQIHTWRYLTCVQRRGEAQHQYHCPATRYNTTTCLDRPKFDLHDDSPVYQDLIYSNA
jgi:hypothetical protein